VKEMILILTTSQALAQGLAALISTFVDVASVTAVQSTAMAIYTIGQGTVGLVILDGGLDSEELTSFLEECAIAAVFPPVLFLMETTAQEERVWREEVISVLKGSAVSELVSIIEMLLNRSRRAGCH
jgi:DNA-binding response OmpR family regulator